MRPAWVLGGKGEKEKKERKREERRERGAGEDGGEYGGPGREVRESVWGPHFPLRVTKLQPSPETKGYFSILVLTSLTSPSAFFVLEK